MLCQKCQTNVATIRYAEVVDGHVTDQHLCPQCVDAIERGCTSGFELADVTPPGRKTVVLRVAGENERNQQACGVCGTPLTAILQHAAVGCPSCYQNFREQIAPMLQQAHRYTMHKGKAARALGVRDRLRSDLHSKRALLRSVVKAENYEEAARLRDEIKRLESGLNVGETGTD